MDNPLELKSIVELFDEHFYIPYYQRGYRWTSQQVSDLLNDIWSFSYKKGEKAEEFYCLQPIVVKPKKWIEDNTEITGWEVIDGQQRLTTLYIIISYLAKEFLKVDNLKEDYGKNIYSLRYETRSKSEKFLENITEDYSNIDYYHIATGYNTVKEWFTNGINAKDRTDKNRFLDTILGKKDDERSVQIIWYNAEAKEQSREVELKKSIDLFTRLNIGKIPLTNAELIKALFLSSSSFENENDDNAVRMKMEISQIWDNIEQKLSDYDFWSFVTNEPREKYATKIELLFDIIAKKHTNEIDPLFTFIYFLSKSKEERPLWELFLSIEQYYLTLCEWYKDKNLYHKIGYLITDGEDLHNLIELSTKEKKSTFESKLDEKIKNSLIFKDGKHEVRNIEDLSYSRGTDYNRIEKVLLLFNVESIRQNKNISEFYPFKFHKQTHWSIEHIHAQNSESLSKTKKEPWFEWLGQHKGLIQELATKEESSKHTYNWKELLDEIDRLNNEKLTWLQFDTLSATIIDVFSEQTDEPLAELHTLDNLALLSQPDNAALNNAVFEVKRREIIRMDKEGHYIPICTRRTFLKYYNNTQSSQQYYFWGKEDRTKYLAEIKNVLRNYLPSQTTI